MSDFIRPSYSTNVYSDQLKTTTGSDLGVELEGIDGVTASAAEINKLDGTIASFTFTPAAGAANVCNVTIQAKDAAGASLNGPHIMTVWLSDTATTGLGLTGTSASGTVTAKAASGEVFGTLTAKKALVVQTLANGSFVLEITDTSKTGFYVAATSGLAKSVSAQLVAGNYGA